MCKDSSRCYCNDAPYNLPKTSDLLLYCVEKCMYLGTGSHMGASGFIVGVRRSLFLGCRGLRHFSFILCIVPFLLSNFMRQRTAFRMDRMPKG